MGTVNESELEFDDLSNADGFNSSINSGSENALLLSGDEGSILESSHRGKNKRIGKRRRQRLQKKLSGLALGTVSEEPCNNASGTPKRPSSASGTTPEMATKKARTYAETVADATVKKFCVRELNQTIALNEEKLQIFRKELGRRILDAAKSSGFVPQLLGCYLADGVIICKASNEETYVWFCGEIGRIKEVWEGCQLSVGEPPKPLILHSWIPGPPENPSVVITNIGIMNPNVSTTGWKVIRCKREANRQSIVFRVDQKSFEHITGSGASLQYVLERIRFRVISGP